MPFHNDDSGKAGRSGSKDVKIKESTLMVLYFAMTFALSWALFIPASIYYKGSITPTTAFNKPVFVLIQSLGAAMPSLTAIFLIRCFYGTETLKEVFKRYKIRKLGIKWYLYSIFLYPLLTCVSISVYLFGDGLPFRLNPETSLGIMLNKLGIFVIVILPVIYVSQIFTSPLLEELGWRGLALPLLQKKYNALTSSSIVGLAWGVWHLPLAYLYHHDFTFLNVLLTVDMVAISIIMTWVFNSTKGSMLTALLFHASLTISIMVLDAGQPVWIAHSLAWVAALTLLFIYGPESLSSKGRITDIIS
jgi:membrane protease YdiL (CAAX protease family)